ncbi:MAG TPA: 2-dehydropantoate 2-reductase N-terminal domain-containing protein, partial [Bacteroidota bacterium]|nr:2-dehydropantoate 2-reductase N-terminal domain-containing protein [Bacteroidota bacterium]
MRFAVIGAGGVGAFFGGMLASGREDVMFLARGSHLDAMKKDGLRILSPGREMLVPSER